MLAAQVDTAEEVSTTDAAARGACTVDAVKDVDEMGTEGVATGGGTLGTSSETERKDNEVGVGRSSSNGELVTDRESAKEKRYLEDLGKVREPVDRG